MKVLIDIDLIFQFNLMVLSLARRKRFVALEELDLIGKSVETALKELLETQEIQESLKNFFKTVRFRPEGFALFNKYAETGIGLLTNIEDDVLDKVLQGNQLLGHRNAFTIVKFDSVSPEFQLALTADEKVQNFLIERRIPTNLVDSRSVDFHYVFENVPWAAAVELTEKYLLQGAVCTGFGRGSREIGFPTANIACSGIPEVLPGVYAAVVELAGTKYKGAVNVGWCPYYQNKDLSYEVYILHQFTESLVGQFLKCELGFYLRSEASFRSLEDLIQAIRLDVALCDKLIQLE